MKSAPGKSQRWTRWALACCLIAGAATLFLSRSLASRRAAEDNAPLDIRGQPIQPLATSRPSEANPAQPAARVAAKIAPVETALKSASSGEDFISVGFDKLASFNFEMPEEPFPTNQTAATLAPKDQIPAEIKAFHQKRIALQGFMLPLKIESGLVTEMPIMRNQSMCCFGTVPKINEWVSVKMAAKGVKPIMDEVVTLFGTLHVGEMRENGYLVGIYQMDGEKMAGPLDL